MRRLSFHVEARDYDDLLERIQQGIVDFFGEGRTVDESSIGFDIDGTYVTAGCGESRLLCFTGTVVVEL